jgi:HEAT repeat protein
MSILGRIFAPPDVEAMKTQRNTQGLLKALGYGKDAGIRAAAAKALFSLGHGETAVRQLRTTDRALALAPLIAVLEERESPSFASLSPAQHAEAILKDMGPPAVRELVGTLKDGGDPGMQKTAACALERLGEGKLAVQTLREMEVSLSVPPLIALLPRKDAAQALAEIGAPAVEALLHEARYPWAYIGRGTGRIATAIGVLGTIGDSRAVEPLLTYLEDESSEVRIAAVEALGRLKDSRVGGSLLPLLYDPLLSIQKAAAAGLDHQGWTPDGGEDDAVYRFVRGELDRCAELGAVAARGLFHALREKEIVGDEAKGERASLMEGLKRIGAPAVEEVSAFLEDENWITRERAVESLGVIGTPEAVAHVITTIVDAPGDFESKRVMGTAIDVLKEAGDARAVKPLIDVMVAWPDQRLAVASALSKLTGEPFSQDPDQWVVWWEERGT